MTAHHQHHESTPLPRPIAFTELKAAATAIAAELRNFSQAPAASGGGSRQRGLPAELRQKFIDVRAALYTRGIYDPVLVRFDTASAPQASSSEVADQLATVAEAL